LLKKGPKTRKGHETEISWIKWLFIVALYEDIPIYFNEIIAWQTRMGKYGYQVSQAGAIE
jgi:hypothetical protein